MADGRSIVYGDESGFACDMPRTHGVSKVGTRCYGLRNFGQKKRTNVIGALCRGSLLAISLFQCNIDSAAFSAWVAQDLIPSLPDNSVVVLDNASFHKQSFLQPLLKKHSHDLLFLPPYSPHLNPIEHKWAQAKALRRKLQCDISTLFKQKEL